MDLAEQIDDFIPSVQSSHSEMDSLIMLIFIVSIVSLFLAWLGRFLYQKYQARKAVPSTSTTTTTGTATTTGAPASPSIASSLLVQKSAGASLTSTAPKSMANSMFSSNAASKGGGGGVGGATAPIAKSRSMSQQSLNAGARKRLTRRSPGPEIQPRRSRSIPPPASVSGPDDTTATWTSHVFKWLYSDLVIVNDLLYGFITSINQTMARNTSENGVLVEVVRVLPESTPPNISNIFCDKSMTSNVSEVVITMDVESTIVLQVKAFRQVAGKTDVLHYRTTIRFKGHLSITMNYMTLVGEMRVEGYPDLKINIASIGPIKTTGKEETEMQDMISESLNLTLREALYPIDFSVHSTCPRALKMEPDDYYGNQRMEFPNPFDYMEQDNHQMQMQMPFNNNRSNMNQPMMSVSSGRRLLVKIVKGDSLMQAKDPYVTVEMDEPPQKNQTGARQGTSPYWDEHFLFDLSNSSSEILFEVYDRPANPNEFPKFLGLGLVGIDELAVGPSSCQTIGLQPRPYETDPVSGAITVEFVFIEGAQVPVGRRPYKLKEALKVDPNQMDQLMGYEAPAHNINPTRLSPMHQRTPQHQQQMMQHQQPQQHQQQPYLNGNDPNRRLNVNPNSISPRTTSPSNDSNSLRPINYSSQQRLSVTALPNGSKQYPYDNSNNASPIMSAKQPVTSTPLKPNNNSLNVKISMIQQSKELSAEPITGSVEERGRERKKTGIFGTLRKRLSRSKTRDENGNGTTNGYNHSNLSNGLDSPTNDTVPQLKNSTLRSTSSRFGIPGSSRRSSISEMSGLSRLSSISNKTFLHEASSLVLEVIENGVKRHYLVPMNIAQKPRWRRKGTKLHIYNDHTFIAKHLPSGLICEICLQSIPLRMGKQGYECRDCSMKCHKQCHVRTPQLCPKPTIQSIELCKISDTDTAIRKL